MDKCKIVLLSVIFIISKINADRMWLSTDDLENHICVEDLLQFVNAYNTTTTSPENLDYATFEDATTGLPVPNNVDCFGLGSLTRQLPWIFNMKPDSSDDVNTHFYFSSRGMPQKVQVYPGDQFGLEWVDFKPSRRTVMIYHGFMSHSNASWVNDMTRAFLERILTERSDGDREAARLAALRSMQRAQSQGNQVVKAIQQFMRQLIAASGARIKDFHFIGHSLGAHISSYVSYHVGGVSRITGLDPAQPCFRTLDHTERLDETDADFVDVIHTNGRLMKKIGLGLPDPTGHADFYPNGGMKQPGCNNSSNSIWARLIPTAFSSIKQAICSHGRAYLLFTESLINNNCSFRAHRWNLTYEGVNASLKALCDKDGSCAEMGIKAMGERGLPRASGRYFVLTTDKEPYCPTDDEVRHPPTDLLRDLREGFIMTQLNKLLPMMTPAYADPEGRSYDDVTTTTENVVSTTHKSWFRRWFG